MTAEWLDRTSMALPHYCLCLSVRDYEHELNELEVPEQDRSPFLSSATANATTHLFYKLPKPVAIVCMHRTAAARYSPIVVAGLLVHEAVHVWQFAVNRWQEENPGDECEAYSIQWISQQLMWSYAEQTRRRKK